MLRRISFLLLGVTLLSTTLVYADVYIIKQGSKYHTQNCRLIANKENQKVSVEEAISQGLAPCGKCIGKKQAGNGSEAVVAITANGKRYHRPDCNLIAERQTKTITLKEAKAKGLEPCGRCFSGEAGKDKTEG